MTQVYVVELGNQCFLSGPILAGLESRYARAIAFIGMLGPYLLVAARLFPSCRNFRRSVMTRFREWDSVSKN